MKNKVKYISFFIIVLLFIFSINVYADSLDSIDVSTDKTTVHPGENVKIEVNFGEQLGAYTIDVAYDKNLLEYVSSEGGTPNDNGTRVRVTYYDSSGGSNPRNSMSVTFRAKEGIITSNPTDLSVTAEGMANSDASVNYDDIGIPIVKNIVVEPVYTDYNIDLTYLGDVIENEEKEMKLTIKSSMGKSYEHTRIIGEVSTQTGGTAKLLATDNQKLEHDILQSGWGDASGDPIGGQNVLKELNVRGLFDKKGDYSITLKLIDRDNSDTDIATETFQISVKEKDITQDNVEGNIEQEETENNSQEVQDDISEEDTVPNVLPKTGNTIYFVIIPIIAGLLISYLYLRKNE